VREREAHDERVGIRQIPRANPSPVAREHGRVMRFERAIAASDRCKVPASADEIGVGARAAQFGAEVVQLAGMQLTDEVIAIIPRTVAKKYRVVPLFKTDGKVGVAIADPSDLNTIDSLTHLLNAEIEPRVASEQDIESALNKYYGGEKKTMEDGVFKDVIQELTESNVEVANVDDDGGAAVTDLLFFCSSRTQCTRSRCSDCIGLLGGVPPYTPP